MQKSHLLNFIKNALFALCIISLTACSTISYYNQSVLGHLDLMWNKQQIIQKIADKGVSDNEREKLRYILESREYASQYLKLPDNDSYTEIAYVNSAYIVWNVNAAPEFSLKPIKWCYLLIGCVSYRGYFAKSNAVEFANTLTTQGLDATISGASAYSTLGWFDDPVMSSMLQWRDWAIAGIIFHELAHQVIYIPDDSAFNEAFAKSVEQIGSLYWLASHDHKKLQEYFSYLKRHQAYRFLLLKTKQSLTTLYNTELDATLKRAKKQEIFAALKVDYQQFKKDWKTKAYDKWFAEKLNNAHFVSDSTYYSKLPIFFALFVEQKANWNSFYQHVKLLGNLENGQRAEKEKELAQLQISLEDIYRGYIQNNL